MVTQDAKKKKEIERFMSLKDVYKVEKGCFTKVFARFKTVSKEKKDLCFSLIGNTRSLDLEMETTQQRDELANFFDQLIQNR